MVDKHGNLCSTELHVSFIDERFKVLSLLQTSALHAWIIVKLHIQMSLAKHKWTLDAVLR